MLRLKFANSQTLPVKSHITSFIQHDILIFHILNGILLQRGNFTENIVITIKLIFIHRVEILISLAKQRDADFLNDEPEKETD